MSPLLKLQALLQALRRGPPPGALSCTLLETTYRTEAPGDGYSYPESLVSGRLTLGPCLHLLILTTQIGRLSSDSIDWRPGPGTDGSRFTVLGPARDFGLRRGWNRVVQGFAMVHKISNAHKDRGIERGGEATQRQGRRRWGRGSLPWRFPNSYTNTEREWLSSAASYLGHISFHITITKNPHSRHFSARALGDKGREGTPTATLLFSAAG